MTDSDVVRRRAVTATQIRHGSTVIDLHDRLTVVTGLDPAAAEELLSALARDDSTLVFGEGRSTIDHRPPASLVLSAGGPSEITSGASTDLQVAVQTAESAFADARAGLEAAEVAYTDAQDELLALRRDADREALSALEEARRRVETAEQGAAAARRAVDAAREESTARESDLGAVRELERRRERMQQAREEVAARLLALPPTIDVGPVATALDGLRRLRTVKPRPMARAVEIADRLQEIDAALAAMTVEAPPEWLVTPALDALRTAKADLDALESGKPTVAVDPEEVRAVEACHDRVLEAESKVMEKGSRSNRRRLDEAAAAEREALHALGLSSYDQFLKYLAPTLDAGAREERLTEARAAVGDAETVWAELHGGSVPEGWTELHLERVTLIEEAHALLGGDVDAEALDETLRSHLESVVDTTWAEDALAQALEAINAPLGAGGIEAAAERVIAEAPAAQQEREQAEAELREIDAELEGIEQELAELMPSSVLGSDSPPDDPSEGPLSLPALEEAAAAAEAALADAQQAVTVAEQRAEKAAELAQREDDAAARAESAKTDVARAREALADAEQALGAARTAAADAGAAVEAAATAAAALAAGAQVEARLSLLGRAAAHRATGQPLVVGGRLSTLGDPDEVVSALRDLSRGVQIVVIDANGTLAGAAEGLGDDARLVRT